MNKWINYNIILSDDLGEGTTDKLIDAYADYEVNQVVAYLKELYPDYEISVGMRLTD